MLSFGGGGTRPRVKLMLYESSNFLKIDVQKG